MRSNSRISWNNNILPIKERKTVNITSRQITLHSPLYKSMRYKQYTVEGIFSVLEIEIE